MDVTDDIKLGSKTRTVKFLILQLLLLALLTACGSNDLPDKVDGDATERSEMLSGSPVEKEMDHEEALGEIAQMQETYNNEHVEPQFLETYGVLMRHINDPDLQISVVYEGDYSDEEKDTFEWYITKAIWTWLRPLRSMPGRRNYLPIVVFTEEEESGHGDLSVRFPGTNGRSYYSSQEEEVVLFEQRVNNYQTYLHEFGHALGLGDVYIEGVWTCQDGQYVNSVMCNPYTTEFLTADDIRGVRHSYCNTFTRLCNAYYYLDKYGGEEGAEATSECVGDDIVGGIRIRHGDTIDSLEIRCRDVVRVNEGYRYVSGTKLGGNGGVYDYHYCRRDQYINGFLMMTDDTVNAVWLLCRSASTASFSGRFGQLGGGFTFYQCPEAYPAVKGVRARHNQTINQLGLTCSTVDGRYSVEIDLF